MIAGENRARLDPVFCGAIADIYKTDFYLPQIKHEIKQYGQAYTYLTINVRLQDNSQVTLEDNIDRLWREWLGNKIKTMENAKEEEKAILKDKKFISILGILGVVSYGSLFSIFGALLAVFGSLGVLAAAYSLSKYAMHTGMIKK